MRRDKRYGFVGCGNYGDSAFYLTPAGVRARLAPRAQDWPWSSVHAHFAGRSEGLTTVEPLLSRYPNFAELFALGPDDAAFDRLRRAESIGRPVGSAAFIAELETATVRRLRPPSAAPALPQATPRRRSTY
jgi:putative transposase